MDARPRAGGSGEAGTVDRLGDTLPVDVAVGLLAALTAETVYRLTGTTPGPRSSGTRP